MKFTQTVYCWGFHSVLLGVSIPSPLVAVFPSPFASSFVGLGGVVTYGLLFIPFGLSNFWSCLPVGALASNLTFVLLFISYLVLVPLLLLAYSGPGHLIFILLPPQFAPYFFSSSLLGYLWGGWEDGILFLCVCCPGPNHLSLYCHLFAYYYFPLGVFVTHDNNVAFCVGAFCLELTLV